MQAPANPQPGLMSSPVDNVVVGSSSASSSSSSVVRKTTLECEVCEEPFETWDGPHFPREIVPCGHTFCTQCIDKHISTLKANGAPFCCLAHSDAIPEFLANQIQKASDCRPNYALIKLMELIQNDSDYQIQGDKQAVIKCNECDLPAVVYCKHCETSYCNDHMTSVHVPKALKHHEIVAVHLRHEVFIPKCTHHTTKEVDFYCKACDDFCCYMCTTVGKHKACAASESLIAVGDKAASSRVAVESCRKSMIQLSDQLMNQRDRAFKSNEDLSRDLDGAQAQIDQIGIQLHATVDTRLSQLKQQLNIASQAGGKLLASLLDQLTTHLSNATVLEEESERVLSMSDSGVIKHLKALQSRIDAASATVGAFLASDMRIPHKLGVTFAFDRLTSLQGELDVYGQTEMSWQRMNGEEVQREVQPFSMSLAEKQFRSEIETLKVENHKHGEKIAELSQAIILFLQDYAICGRGCDVTQQWNFSTPISERCTCVPSRPNQKAVAEHEWRFHGDAVLEVQKDPFFYFRNMLQALDLLKKSPEEDEAKLHIHSSSSINPQAATSSSSAFSSYRCKCKAFDESRLGMCRCGHQRNNHA